MKLNLKVKGMHCKSCKMLVEETLLDIGVKDISISIDEKKQLGTVMA
jgi:copper chaperone CopZ